MKKFLPVFILLFSLIIPCANTAHAEKVDFFINGEEETGGLFIYNLEGKDYTALQDLERLLNLTINWDAVTERVLLKTRSGRVSFILNSPRIIVNERIRYLSYPARLLNGGVIVPMQFLTEIIPEVSAYKVNWEVAARRLNIQTKEQLIVDEKDDYSPVKLSSHKLGNKDSDKTGRYLRRKRKNARTPNYSIDLIVIDPGHGGRDPGAIGRKGLKEKDIVMDISNKVAKKLKAKGIKVILTRRRDKFIPLDERAAIANRNRADLFMSIHANAAFTRRAGGFETYYVSEAVNDHARAVAAIENSVLELEGRRSKTKLDDTLHAILWDLAYTEFRVESIEWGKIVQQELAKKIRGDNRGVKPAPFYVLKGAQMPSLLVEVGFVSNAVEEANLRKSSYRSKIAEALANSIIRYKKIYEKKAGFTR